MVAREDISKGMEAILRERQHSLASSYGNAKDSNLFITATVQMLKEYLHSQGVVIKVKCPDCEWSQFEGEVAGMTPCYSCNSTGYIIEPLI